MPAACRTYTSLLIVLAILCAPALADEGGVPSNPTPSAGGEEGDLTTNFNFFPVIFYSPETSVGGGLGFTYTWRDRQARRPNSLQAIFFYTANNQALIALAPELRLDQGRWLIRFGTSYKKFPDVIYGLGNDTEEDAEEEYTTEGFELSPELLHFPRQTVGLGASFFVRKSVILEHEAGGFVSEQILAGTNRGWVSGMGPLLEWDSRDNVFAPTRGVWCQLLYRTYREAFGSEADFEESLFNLRYYYPLGIDHALAFQFVSLRRTGELFFIDYPTLGEFQRGILAGRYQDRQLISAQAEWRFPLSRRFSGALFAAGGQVARDWDGLALADTKASAGGGIRYALNPEEKIRVRFDLGFGEQGMQFYVNWMEAF